MRYRYDNRHIYIVDRSRAHVIVNLILGTVLTTLLGGLYGDGMLVVRHNPLNLSWIRRLGYMHETQPDADGSARRAALRPSCCIQRSSTLVGQCDNVADSLYDSLLRQIKTALTRPDDVFPTIHNKSNEWNVSINGR